MEFGQNSKSLAPVVALTIIDESTLNHGLINKYSMILAVVRNEETNQTHPNVVSTPTQRIPLGLHKSIITSENKKRKEINISTKYGEFESNGISMGHEPIIYAVESIFSKKLGLSDSLEFGHINFKASLGIVKEGISYHHSTLGTEPIPHHISMMNIIVIVTSGIEYFPKKTASYSHILWTSVGKFTEMVINKDPTRLSMKLNPFKYCVHGLCISTTNNILLKVLKK